MTTQAREKRPKEVSSQESHQLRHRHDQDDERPTLGQHIESGITRQQRRRSKLDRRLFDLDLLGELNWCSDIQLSSLFIFAYRSGLIRFQTRWLFA